MTTVAPSPIGMGTRCITLTHPVDGGTVGTVTDVKSGCPYPFYLTSDESDRRGDMGPYAAHELEVVERDG